MTDTDQYFTYFQESAEGIELPRQFNNPFDYDPHPLCILAANQLQHHLSTQKEWEHNFGLDDEMEGDIIGKMFGVMVVRNEQGEIGYLSAFSGTLASVNHHSGFVPPVYDGPAEDGFLNDGMAALGQITTDMKALEKTDTVAIDALKEKRKAEANVLTERLFEQYHFLNKAGEEKSLLAIFRDELKREPPGGAGECAAPKLLHFAFQYNLQPLAMAEFFWGQSRGSDYWQHKQFYPACEEKCKPILGYMLEGLEVKQ
ncbi:MAG: pseudouridylate synthase [Flavobacteriales bacterium]|nr:pseudouridylate synthase [Flavobacteriales bacterium]